MWYYVGLSIIVTLAIKDKYLLIPTFACSLVYTEHKNPILLGCHYLGDVNLEAITSFYGVSILLIIVNGYKNVTLSSIYETPEYLVHNPLFIAFLIPYSIILGYNLLITLIGSVSLLLFITKYLLHLLSIFL